MKKTTLRSFFYSTVLATAALISNPVLADNYQIDSAHSFLNFSVGHLGVSIARGRFNDISGDFTIDAESPTQSRVNVLIKTASVDTGLEKRDKHLRSPDFFDVKQFPEMLFNSSGYEGTSEEGTITGDLTLHGVTKRVSFAVEKIGEGDDRRGLHRAGFVVSGTIKRSDFGMSFIIPAVGDEIEIAFSIEGIRQ